MGRRYLFIVNPFSGAGEGGKVTRLLNRLLPQYPAFGGGAAEVRMSDELTPDRLRGLLSGARVVVAGGGDGTVSTLLPYLLACDSPPALSMIPLGTSNDLARAVGIPVDKDYASEASLRAMLEGLPGARSARLDILSVNGEKFFCNYFGIGLDAAIVHDFVKVRDSRQTRWLPRGRLTKNALYFLMGLKNAGFRLEPPIEIVFSGEDEPRRLTIDTRIRAIIVSNLPVYAGGCALCPDARVDDGLFEVTIVRNAYEFVRLILTRFLGFLGRPGRLAQYRTARAQLRMSCPSPSQIDGEKGPDNEVMLPTLEIAFHSALSVLIPDQL